jgi:hypothetical protein
MEHGFYHPDRGYWQTNDDVSEDILATYPEGTVEVDLPGHSDQRFDGAALRWVDLTTAEMEEKYAPLVRFERDILLRQVVDPVVTNPLRWSEMTSEKQQEWADYRAALLQIPDQEGFPLNVVWPTKPE